MTHITPDAIRALRRQRGWSIQDVAERVGVTPAAVGHWETGIRRPCGPAALLLSRLLARAAKGRKKSLRA